MKDWKDIHKDFGSENGKLWKSYWEECGFDYQQVKDWIKIVSLRPDYSVFAWWLVTEKKISPKKDLNIEKLEKEYEKWEKKWLNIDSSFRPLIIMRWKKRGFGTLEVEQWIDAGLGTGEYELATQLKETSVTPQQCSNFKTQNAQEWIDHFYPLEKRVNIKKLNISNKSSEGSLKLERFTNLEELDCSENELTNLDLSGCVKLRELDCSDNKLTSLDIINLTNLQELDCRENQLINLNCNGCLQLEKIKCGENKLIDLNLNNCSNITFLNCYKNSLTNLDFLQDLDSKKLGVLFISENNFSPSDLTLFARFVNLKKLGLFDTHFYGSLTPLQKLTKLEYLNIISTDIEEGLEYLPESLEKFWWSDDKKFDNKKVKKIEERLRNFGEPNNNNFIFSVKEYKKKHELNKPSKRGWKTNLEGIDIAPLIPLPLLETFKGKIKLKENYNLKDGEKISYQEIYVQKPSTWNSPPKGLLPIKLYNIDKDRVEWTKDNQVIENYAIVSYVWGMTGTPSSITSWNTQYKGNLNPAGYKTLYKSIQVCKLLGIDYLWMDQLCIDQNSTEEKNREVPKMGQYYGNSVVTLISIQTKLNEKATDKPLTIDIIEKIIRSEWFRRSWTFQEGWLSKHTIFMFDDMLVDGRTLAVDWVLYQPGYSEYTRVNVSEASEGSVKVATPIGWVYFKNGYSSDDKISLTLSQVLRGIKEKDRTLAIDGIYSVLGMLPYGKDVEVNYKPRECSKCPNGIETEKGCNHEEKKWPIYIKEDIESALFEVIKKAWESGYAEPLAWHGDGLGLLPKISIKTGSTSMVGGISVRKTPNLEKTTFISENIKINGFEYTIDSADNKLDEVESGRQGFLIEGGLCAKGVQVKVEDKSERIKLWGTREALKEAKKKRFLIIPNNNEWESNIPFAILAEKKDNSYHRLGLVELRNDADKLKGESEKELTFVISSNVDRNEKTKQTENNTLEQEEKLKNLDQQIQEKKDELEDMNNNILKVKEELGKLEKEKDELLTQIQILPKGNNQKY